MITTAVVDAAVVGPLRHAPGRTLLAVLAIALGVALGLAIYLINRAAADEISIAARSLYGLADLSIEGAGEGFDESMYPRVARIDGVAAVSPIVEIEARLSARRAVITLIGVDVFRSRALQPSVALATPIAVDDAVRPGGAQVYLSAAAARDFQLAAGDVLRVQSGLRTIELPVAAVLPPSALKDDSGVIDIAFAQQAFDRLGRLSRIDIRLASGASVERVREALSELAPPGVQIVTPGAASDDALRLSRAYRSNLTALALVALFTGGFFVYSTQSLMALKRRREFAILHALGVTRARQLAFVLAGSALIGVLGAVIGLALGVWIARIGLERVGGDLGAGFFRGVAPTLSLPPLELAGFALLGVATAMVGALRPALEAARTPTATALKAGDVAGSAAQPHMALVVALLALAALALFAPPIAGLPLPGYVAIALLLIAVVAAAPSVVRAVVRRAPLLHAAPYQVAIAQIAGAARYATMSVAAIIVSFSLMTSMAIMVNSFRGSLDAWTQKLLPADLYVRVGYVGQSSHIDAQTARAMARLPGVARAEFSRFAAAQIVGAQRRIAVVTRTLDPRTADGALWITATTSKTAPAEAIGVWVNEAGSDLLGWRPGDTREVVLGGRTLRAFAYGVWRDYEHQSGAIVMAHDDYVRLSGDEAVNTVWLWLESDATLAQVQSGVRDLLPAGAAYDLRTPAELRRLSLAAFDRTFAVTYVLELVAIFIGLFGIAAGMSAQVLARRGELGALRHLGFTRGQIAGMLAIEGAALGALGVLIGLISGGVISLILIYVVNRQSFHWSMDVSAPLELLALLSAGLIGAAAIIAVLAGRNAMSGDVVSAVKEDW